MTEKVLYQPFEIEFGSFDDFPEKMIRSNFFTLVFVREGSGVQFLNGHKFNYRAGNLFLITPQDQYGFQVHSESKFFILRFNASFVTRPDDNDWIDRMTFILNNASHRPGCILKNKVDKPVMASLTAMVMDELSHGQIYHSTIVLQLVNAIVAVVARNIALKLPKNIKENTGEPILDILEYIQKNIANAKKLRTAVISKALSISPGYIGRYFKKQTGETLQQYILSYKLRIVEARLSNTDMRINEIVDDLGFTDESHLNRLFKKYKGVAPTEFRKLRTNA